MSAKSIKCSRVQLAEALGLSIARISQLVLEKVIPRPAARGEYDTLAAVKAYITHLQAGRTSNSLAKQRERLLAAQAAKAEHELQKDLAGYIPISDVERFLGDVLVTQRQHLMSLKSVLEQQIGDTQAEKLRVMSLTDERVREYLNIIADRLKGLRRGKIAFDEEDEHGEEQVKADKQ